MKSINNSSVLSQCARIKIFTRKELLLNSVQSVRAHQIFTRKELLLTSAQSVRAHQDIHTKGATIN